MLYSASSLKGVSTTWVVAPPMKKRLAPSLLMGFMSLILPLSSSILTSLPAQADEAAVLGYQKAPSPLDDLLNIPSLPAMSLSPDRRSYALLEQQELPSLAELAEPELRLAGLRINPDNQAPSRGWNYVGIKLYIEGADVRAVKGLPVQPRLSNIQWSPDGRSMAFSHTTTDQVELWLLDITTAQARRVDGIKLNKSYGVPFSWSPDSQSLIVKTVTRALPLPASSRLPSGPVVMQSDGKASPGRTYQDLLRNPDDVARFKHYLHTQLQRVTLDGRSVPLGQPGLIVGAIPSPNGEFLLVEQFEEPFSYAFPAFRFPLRSELWNTNGQLVKTVATLPLADKIPIHFDAVRPGRRNIDWRADAPASLYWLEALDGGDPDNKPENGMRDRLWLWSAPFDKAPVSRLDVPYRIDTLYWGGDDLALAYTDWYQNRQSEVWLLHPDGQAPAKKVKSFSSEDRYAHPGYPLTRRSPAGTTVLERDGQNIYLSGAGASPEGEKPFVDRWNPNNNQLQHLWRSSPPWYEQPVQLIDSDTLLIRRENPDEPPNYYLRSLKSGELKALTAFPHPMPMLREVTKQIIEYTRADGVKLNGTLYLPPGYKPGSGPLPLVMWAYPREFKSSAAAGQVKGSPHSFVRLSPTSPLVFLTQGYAVLDDPAMPIIGEGKAEPNDTYIQQLVSSAQAAVDKVVSMGVADRKRIAIGGHSYGAFMTVNLLAHSDLFAAGVARSGAYNRTLTPFGFQSEQRTLWQAPDVYRQLSPLLYADKIKEPLLLVHGEADDNSGTFPMQSQNLYAALKGLGAPVRLVMLPYESHGYRAKESLGHMLWEMTAWLDKHLKK